MIDGQKYDEGKTRIELFPGDALFAISQVLTFGAKKYDARNWEKGISWGRVYGALMRHLWAWWQGNIPTTKNFLFGKLDVETGMSHLWHAGCCLVFLIAYEMRDMRNYDDRPLDQVKASIEPGVVCGAGGCASSHKSPWVRAEQMDPITYKTGVENNGI